MSGQSVPVYDRVPGDASPPYIVIGQDHIPNRWSTKQWEGADVIHTVHVWSTYPGSKEIKEIRDEIVQRITNGTIDLSADNFKVVIQHIHDSPPLIREGLDRSDATDELRHAVIRFFFKIKNTN